LGLMLRQYSNDLGTNLAVNHRQFSVVISQLLVDEARVEVVARTLEVISEHNTMTTQLASLVNNVYSYTQNYAI